MAQNVTNVVKDKFFTKQMLVPILVFITGLALSTKAVIDKMEVRVSSLEHSVQELSSSHVSKLEFEGFKSEVRLRSDDPYRAKDAQKDLALRDVQVSELNRRMLVLESSIHEIRKYLIDDWNWNPGQPKGVKR